MSRLNDIKFPVIEIPAIGQLPKGFKDREHTGYKFIMREDTGQILSCMTTDYKLVTNKTILSYAEPIIKKNGGVIKETKLLNGGCKSVMSWKFPNEKINIGKDDDLTPEIIIKNSYDGSVGLNILAGAFRLVCSNGMIVGNITAKYTNKHIVHNIALDNIEKVIVETIDKTKIKMYKIDISEEENNEICEKCYIKSVPTFLLFKDRTYIDKVNGADIDKLLNMIKMKCVNNI